MILVVDNYDSFTWNLVQYLRVQGAQVIVRRNDSITVPEAAGGAFEGIVISPGPGGPERAGVSGEIVRRLGGHVPILGVCLGHQVIAQAMGGRVVRAPAPVHGKASPIRHDGRGLLAGMPDRFPATRYHSLVVDGSSLPEDVEISATTDDGLVMGVRVPAAGDAPLEGVQFHPESILTTSGMIIIENFLRAVAARAEARADVA